jgi:glycosyltransferase involved in cell wall biosynthesis
MNVKQIIAVVPTYNNPKTIYNVIADIVNHNYKVIVVDDGSDITVESLLQKDFQDSVTIVRHPQNQGKGRAIISGTNKAKELGYTHIVTLDGDGQHLASQIDKLVSVCNRDDEIIIGARNFDLDNVPKGSKFGRWFSNFWACWDTGYKITDSLSGFRIYPISIIDLAIKTDRFDWEMEVLVRHADSGQLIKEVDIECYYPLEQERVSHFRKFEDTMAIVWVHVQILPFKWLRYFKNLIVKK